MSALTPAANTASVLAAAERAIIDQSGAYLTHLLDEDALLPAGQRMYAGALPVPHGGLRGSSMDHAANTWAQTPTLSLWTRATRYTAFDAANAWRATTELVARVMISEADVNATTPALFQNAATAYGAAISWVLYRYLDSAAYGAPVGVYSAQPVNTMYGFEARDPNTGAWIRSIDTIVQVEHRILHGVLP